MIEYDTVIGIEIHCQLASEKKIFCQSENAFGNSPNYHIDPTCTGLPGALPVLNPKCVSLALRLALATDSAIAPRSSFDRKNYFYPDNPKGYQITQFRTPFCSEGQIILKSGKKIRIQRIQLEEDAGKSIHVGDASLLDYNRSGVGLIEIVSHPDISSPEEAIEYLKIIHNLVVHLEISDGNMEQGNFRADANVSIKPKGSPILGNRVEIKNVNSFKYLEKAVQYEVQRQARVLSEGQKIVQETRGFDSDKNETFSQRTKEDAQDYRYFPEPDLPDLLISEEWISSVKEAMPELPQIRSLRYQEKYDLPTYDADLIASWKEGSQYFDHLLSKVSPQVTPKIVSNFYMAEILKIVKIYQENKGTQEITEVPYPLDWAATILLETQKGKITGRLAKEVLDLSFEKNQDPKTIIQEKGFTVLDDPKAIEKVIQEIALKHPSEVKAYQEGKEKLFGFFVGQVMKVTAGKADPKVVNDILKKVLLGK